jgi:hypothetical protein
MSRQEVFHDENKRDFTDSYNTGCAGSPQRRLRRRARGGEPLRGKGDEAKKAVRDAPAAHAHSAGQRHRREWDRYVGRASHH